MNLVDLFGDGDRCTVSEYTRAVKSFLEREIPACWILGEVSNLRRQQSGHIYFSLKDSGAQLPAVMFRGNASRLGFPLEEGMEVLAFGEISVYEPHGRYQLIVRTLKESGQGRLYKEFERLKRQLEEEGLFDVKRKKKLPIAPLRIAVVSSPTGAALRDFLQVLSRRNWNGSVRLFPCKVQGQGAGEEIARSIELANRIGGFDLIVATRGGGSIEDLWSFNEERVARAVFASSIPVISGVGHEIDFTLSDFAADIRAETPTAAAELISSLLLDTISRVNRASERMVQRALFQLEEFHSSLRFASQALAANSPDGTLENAFLRLDEIESRIGGVVSGSLQVKRAELMEYSARLSDLNLKATVGTHQSSVSELGARMNLSMERLMNCFRSRFESARIKASVMSPEATLDRGFAILENADGQLVTSVSVLKTGDKLKANLRDGSVKLAAEKVSKRKGN